MTELIGVNHARQAVILRRAQKAPRLLDRERAGLAEDVHRIGQTFGGDRRNHPFDDFVAEFRAAIS